MKSVLLINLKAYEECIGVGALKIAEIAESLANDKVEIILATQPTDIRTLSENNSIPVFAQHVDPVTYGSRTGHILPEAVKNAGAVGTLINHSERQINIETIEKTIARCKEIGLRTVVCTATPEMAKEIAVFKPDYIAIEPPELIGGDISVSKAKPEIIRNSVKNVADVNDTPVLCGAGVKNCEDVEKAIDLGASGILVASGVVKSSNVKEAILDLLAGF